LLLLAPAAHRCRWPPRGQILAGQSEFGAASLQFSSDGVGDRFTELRIDLVMPLTHPRQQLRQPRQQRSHPLSLPAVVETLTDQRSQRERLLTVIPPRPTEQLRGIAVLFRARVGDESFPRHIELPALRPERGLPEISG